MKDNWDRRCSHWSLLQPQPLLMLLPSLRCIMLILYAHISCNTRHIEGFVLALQVTSAAASGVASFAVLEDGTVWGWGSSRRGQLGLGQGIVEALKPQRLPGLEGITEVSAGWGHACALRGKPTCKSTLIAAMPCYTSNTNLRASHMVAMVAEHTSTTSLQAYPTQRVPHSLHLSSQTMLTIMLILQIPLLALFPSQQSHSTV